MRIYLFLLATNEQWSATSIPFQWNIFFLLYSFILCISFKKSAKNHRTSQFIVAVFDENERKIPSGNSKMFFFFAFASIFLSGCPIMPVSLTFNIANWIKKRSEKKRKNRSGQKKKSHENLWLRMSLVICWNK